MLRNKLSFDKKILYKVDIEILWPIIDLFFSFFFNRITGVHNIDLKAYLE
jgi:hypothetical protein